MSKIVRIFNRLIRPKKKWEQMDSINLVESKFERIHQLIEGKDVLDCGCVGDVIDNIGEYERSSNAMHGKHAKYIIGVDIWGEEIKKRQAMGVNMVCANVENMELGRCFDVVIAGDLIEHLANPGLFLENANKHLRKGGMLYICTPNPWSFNNVVRSILGVKINVHPEHCSWYDFNTLNEILSRYGFSVKEKYLQDYCERNVLKYILRFRNNLANSIIVIAEKDED